LIKETLETKDRIIEGAAELFFAYGIRNVSMDDLAKQIGMSKKTIYQYFADKDELVYAFMQLGMMEQIKEMKETAEKSENVIEELYLAMIKTREMFSKVNPLMLFELKKYHPKAWELFNQCKEGEMQEHLIKTLRKGIKEGVFRSEINVEVLAKMRLELVQIIFDPKIFPPTQFNFLEVNLQLFEHFIYGIITLKGLNLLNQYKKQNQEARTALEN
jgi:AcrR family transcriptional regulator